MSLQLQLGINFVLSDFKLCFAIMTCPSYAQLIFLHSFSFFSNHTTPPICLCSCKLIIASCAATSKYLRHIPMPTPQNHFPQENLYLDITPSMFQMLGTYDQLWAHGKQTIFPLNTGTIPQNCNFCRDSCQDSKTFFCC